MRKIRAAFLALIAVFLLPRLIECSDYARAGITSQVDKTSIYLHAQEYGKPDKPSQPEHTFSDSRQGVLYTVTAVILIVWFGLAFFLYRLDRKITRMERITRR